MLRSGNRLSSVARAKHSDGFCGILFARVSSQTSRSRSLARSEFLVVRPGLRLARRSASRAHTSYRVSRVGPRVSVIDRIAAHLDADPASCQPLGLSPLPGTSCSDTRTLRVQPIFSPTLDCHQPGN